MRWGKSRMGTGIFRVKVGRGWGQGWFYMGAGTKTGTTERVQRNTLAVATTMLLLAMSTWVTSYSFYDAYWYRFFATGAICTYYAIGA